MKMLYTFASDTPAIDTETAVVISKFERYSSRREEFDGYEARLPSGAIVEFLFGYYRTPVVKHSQITWTDHQRVRPLLSEGDQVEFQETPSGNLVWCPADEWDEVTIALAHEQREQRELEEGASHPELRIIHDNERHTDNPIIVWNGWLRKELHTFSGTLPRGYDGYVIERYNREDDFWESEYNPEATFGRLVNSKHAKKRATA